MKLYTELEIAKAISLATDSVQVVEEVFGILARINEDEKFADQFGLKQNLHLKSVLLREKKTLGEKTKYSKDREFTLFDYMCEILHNFYEENNLKHCCALDSIIGGNYKTQEQKEWLKRFSRIWEKIEERENDRE